MDESRASLTVYFEAPFWVGLYQREWNGQCQVCKITFGAEPKDYEVYQFLLDNWRRLRFSPPVAAGPNRAAANQPQADAAGDQKAAAIGRGGGHGHKSPAGPEIAAGGGQAGPQSPFSNRKRGGTGTKIRPAPGKRKAKHRGR